MAAMVAEFTAFVAPYPLVNRLMGDMFRFHGEVTGDLPGRPVFCLQEMQGLFQEVPVNTPVPRNAFLTDICTFLRNPPTVTSQTG